MKFISITGHIEGMNHAISRYLSRFDIQLEKSRHAMMRPFTTLNPYAQTLQKAERFAEIAGEAPLLHVPILPAEAVNLVESVEAVFESRGERLRELEKSLATLRREAEVLENFTDLNIDLAAVKTLEFFHFRLGRLTLENARRLEKFASGDARFSFLPASRNKTHVYGIFFTPSPHADEIDALFASLDFEAFEILSRTPLPKTDIGRNFTAEKVSPAKLLHYIKNEIHESECEIAAQSADIFSGICSAEKLAIACAKVRGLYAAFDVKKFAAVSEGGRVFTFSGWVSADDADALEAEIESDDALVFTRHVTEARPPILLRNLPIIRQFEFFTRLYGLPEYGEVDPTPLLAVTYTLLFGLMFGDIGHGGVLAVAGIFVRRKHVNLGGIMTVVGISAAFFGVLYGSVFGVEFSPLWRRPAENIAETLIFAAALGAGLIVLSMLVNMYNSFRRGRIADALFGANGVAGLLFYSAAIWLALRIFTGQPLTPFVIAVAALPLVFVCLKHPLEQYFAGAPSEPPKSHDSGDTFSRSRLRFSVLGNIAIELFETLLSYATNTVSFVRVGAFAVSHAGMMHVVLQMGRGAAASGIIILILGNVLVMVIEGLLIGIQVLRLDFYEIFSRFYKGTGQAFHSTSKNSP